MSVLIDNILYATLFRNPVVSGLMWRLCFFPIEIELPLHRIFHFPLPIPPKIFYLNFLGIFRKSRRFV